MTILRPFTNSSRSLLATIVCLLLLAFALRVWVLDDRTISHNELRQYRQNLSDAPLWQIPFGEGRVGAHLAALLMAKGSAELLGDTLFSLRWPGVCLSLMNIALVYRIGCWLLDNKAGLGAAFLLTISPMAVSAAYEFKGYNAMVFFVLLAYLLSIRGLQKRSRRYWYLAGVAWALAVYSHLYSALAWFGLAGVIILWYRQRTSHWRHLVRDATLPLGSGAIGIVAATAAALGPAVFRLLSAALQGNLPDISAIYRPQQADQAATFISSLLWFGGMTTIGNAPGEPAVAYLLLGLAGLTLLLATVRRRVDRVIAILGALVLPFVVYHIINWLRPDIVGRESYFGYTLPFFLYLVVSAPFQIRDAPARVPWVSRVGCWLSGAAIIVGVAWSWGPSLSQYFVTETEGNWTPVAAYLAERVTARDLILCEPFDHVWGPDYEVAVGPCERSLTYWMRAKGQRLIYGIKPLVEASDYEDLSANLRVANRFDNVWLVLFEVPPGAQIQDANGRPYPEWNRFGRTVVIGPPKDVRIVDALTIHLEQLSAWSPAAASQLFYHMRLAQLANMLGQTERAGQEWQRVEMLRPLVPQAEKETKKAQRTLDRPSIVQAPSQPMRVSLGDVIRLDGFSLGPGPVVRAGDVVRLTLFWHALRQPPVDYTVFVHFTNSAHSIVFQDDFHAGVAHVGVVVG